METQPLPQRVAVLRMPRKLREQLHLDRAQKSLRGPEAKADLHDLIGGRIRTHVGTPRCRWREPSPNRHGSVLNLRGLTVPDRRTLAWASVPEWPPSGECSRAGDGCYRPQGLVHGRLMKQKQYSSRPPEPSPGARKCRWSTMWL